MGRFLDLYSIVRCKETDSNRIEMTVKSKKDNKQTKFIYSPDERIDNPLAQMLYDELHHNEIYQQSEEETLSNQVRSDRYRLLYSTDIYLSIPDYPITDDQRNEIREYRQALRDITKQPGFPKNVVWPKVPDCIRDKISM